MFEKEYITQKFILFISIIFILGFIGKNYLTEKNGISASEGLTYAICNTEESLADSPFNTSIYDNEELEKNVTSRPSFFSLYYITSYLKGILVAPEQSTILAKQNTYEYTNENWVHNDYYTNLLSISKEEQFQYKMVRNNCIATGNSPLYYYILHTVTSIFGSLSMIRLGFCINVVFLFLSGFLFLDICRTYLRASWAGFAAALLFTFSVGCCSGAICATPYLMVIFFLLLSAYLHLEALKSWEPEPLVLGILAVVQIAGNLTDYSYSLFSLAIGFCFCSFCLLTGRGSEIWKYLLTNVIATVISIIFYPACLLHWTTLLSNGIQTGKHSFSLQAFSENCKGNISTLNNQLFLRTGVLIVALLIILFILALILKKETFQEQYDNFVKRLEEGEVGELFIPAFVIAYFLLLTFLYGKNDYLILLTLLPFIAMFFCYLSYSLCKTAMHSEFNSGIFVVVVVCVLCFISCTMSTPNYIYADDLAKTQFAETYQDQYCIFLSSDELHAADHILELEKYQHSLVISKDQLKLLKKNEEFLNQKQLLVYLSIHDYTNAEMDKIAKYGNFHICEEVTSYLDKNSNKIYIYQLRKID